MNLLKALHESSSDKNPSVGWPKVKFVFQNSVNGLIFKSAVATSAVPQLFVCLCVPVGFIQTVSENAAALSV